METTGFTIEEFDVRTMSDDDIARSNEFGNIMKAESRPEDPPTPLEMSITSIRNIPSMVTIKAFRVTGPDGAHIASSQAVFLDMDTNKHLAQADIGVHPEHRRRGMGMALFAKVVEATEQAGRTLIMGGTSERVPAGEAFAEAIGAEAAYADHTNRLVLSEVDRAMLDTWVAEGPVKGAGYSLVSIDGPYPEEHLPQIIKAIDLMNTAPRENLQMEDFKLTPDLIREMEKSMAASGAERWALFARHDATGEFVGLTETMYQPKLPKTVGQGGTAVDPAHRGHGLAKWMKAAMLKRILDERPQAEDVRTGNADSNEAMLAINTKLGFKPHVANRQWQMGLEAAKAFLTSKSP